MMRNLFYTLALSLFTLLMLIGGDSKASHVMGGDLSYQCLGNNQYKITMTLYRDCASSLNLPNTVTVQAAGCNSTASVSLTKVFQQELDVTPLCPALKPCNTCNNNPPSFCPSPLYPGTQMMRYEGTITLNTPCPNWKLSYTLCCRNNAIQNVPSPGGKSFYIEATLNNVIQPCNNSPTFAELPTPYICANQLYNYNHGVLEPDGDSISYTVINSMDNGGTPIAFSNPYSTSNPIPNTGNFSFNNANGQMSVTPNQTFIGIMAVKVCEYRQDTLGTWVNIGCIMRDMQIVVINCPSNQIPPELSNVQNVGGGGYILDTNSVGVCPNTPLTFDVLGFDLNGTDSVFLSSNIQAAIGGNANYSVNYLSIDSAIISFSWTPGIADSGTHYFTITIKDNHCPTYSSQTYVYSIVVQNEVTAGPDVKYCAAGGPVKLTAKGGSIFSWTPTSSIVGAAPDSSWILVAPTQTTDYLVVTDCNQDTVRVEVVPDFNYTLTPNDTICRFETSQLNMNADPTYAPYVYTWTPNDSISSTTAPNVTVSPWNTTTYYIETISDDGCKIIDSVEVFIKGESPRVQVTASKDFLCPGPGDQTQLFVNAQPGSCGPNTTGCNGNSTTSTMGSGTDLSGQPTPYEGQWDKQRMQILYRAADLNAAGIYGGTITSMAFEVGDKASSKAYSDFSIKMQCTSMSDVGTSFTETGFTQVLAPTSVNTTMGWNTHTFTTDYDWDGSSNILVEICFTNTGSYTNDDDVFSTTVSYPATLIKMADNLSTGSTAGCDLISPLPAYSTIPNTQFAICSQSLSNFGISWTPTDGLSDSTSGNPFVFSQGMTQTTTYTVEVDNVGCYGYGDITIHKDTTQIILTNDTAICNIQPIQLDAQIIGNPPVMTMTCGANGTTVVNPAVSHQVGNGTASFGGTMFSNTEDMRYQLLYKATDLQSNGLDEGIITELAIELATKASSNSMSTFTIKMGCTSANSVSASSWLSAPHVVYTGNNISTTMGWNNFTLTNPFDWDGTSNIVVEICWDNPSGSPLNGLDQIRTYDVTYNSIARGYGVNTSGCSIGSPSTTYMKLPNTKFSVSPPPPGNFNFTWTPAGTLDDPTSLTPIASPTTTTTYVFTTDTEMGCTISDSVTISVNLFQPGISADVDICEGESVTLTASGGATYSWSPTTGITPSTGSTVTASPSITTTYTVTVTDGIGCTGYEEVTVTVHDNPIVDAGQSDSVIVGAPIVLNASGADTYSWTPASLFASPTSANPEINPTTTVTYTVVGTTIHGCVGEDTVTIYVYSVDDIYIPTAFSPNGDGRNDRFTIQPKGLSEILEFKIFNRWGETVFESVNFDIGWDGKYNGENQPIGTYIYLIKGKRYDGTIQTYSGNITLLR